MPIDATIDAKSVYESIRTVEAKMPMESSLIAILLVARETLQTGRVRALHWCDTRDMLADGMNKGSISRKAIVDCMKTGVWKVSWPSVRHTHRATAGTKTYQGPTEELGDHPPYQVDQNHAPPWPQRISQSAIPGLYGYSHTMLVQDLQLWSPD